MKESVAREEERIANILSNIGELRIALNRMGGFHAELADCRLCDGPGGSLACINWGDTSHEALIKLYERIRDLGPDSWVVNGKNRQGRLVRPMGAQARQGRTSI